MIDIIVPTYNQEIYTVRCLKSIKEFTFQNYRIIWIDNGSTCLSRQKVLVELKDHNYLSVWLQEKVGFVKAVNIGLNQCHNDYVVILNNDTEVTMGWLDLLLLPLEKNNSIVASGPLTTIKTSHQDIENMRAKLPKLNEISGKYLINIHSLQKKLYDIFGPDYYVEMEKLAFFCTAFKRFIFDEIGGLDERFEEGYSDDVDFSRRVKQNGYELVLVPAAYVEHYHQQTLLSIYTKKEASAMLHRNRKILEQKWDGTSGK